ncbi:MAG: hypothetical protein ACR2JU_13955 [Nocardioidaceae bacterium]
MLHEVRRPGSFGTGGGLQPSYGIPLVVAREDDQTRLRRAAAALLDMDEAPEQVEPGLALPDVAPEVRRGVTAGVRGVAGATGVA